HAEFKLPLVPRHFLNDSADRAVFGKDKVCWVASRLLGLWPIAHVASSGDSSWGHAQWSLWVYIGQYLKFVTSPRPFFSSPEARRTPAPRSGPPRRRGDLDSAAGRPCRRRTTGADLTSWAGQRGRRRPAPGTPGTRPSKGIGLPVYHLWPPLKSIAR